jgi:hypothetical protein
VRQKVFGRRGNNAYAMLQSLIVRAKINRSTYRGRREIVTLAASPSCGFRKM